MNPSERIDRILEILDNPTQRSDEPMAFPRVNEWVPYVPMFTINASFVAAIDADREYP